ncbi:ChaN family lipoprotein, partial [Kingella kingae]
KVQTALSQIISNHHGGGNMVAMQQYKDFRMAQALLQSPKPAWLIAGNIHASKQLGVPLFLQDAGFSGSLKVLLLSSKDNEIDKQHADYIWLF